MTIFWNINIKMEHQFFVKPYETNINSMSNASVVAALFFVEMLL